jgi:hypothetical protein
MVFINLKGFPLVEQKLITWDARHQAGLINGEQTPLVTKIMMTSS